VRADVEDEMCGRRGRPANRIGRWRPRPRRRPHGSPPQPPAACSAVAQRPSQPIGRTKNILSEAILDICWYASPIEKERKEGTYVCEGHI
jgi:hypothetical protein